MSSREQKELIASRMGDPLQWILDTLEFNFENPSQEVDIRIFDLYNAREQLRTLMKEDYE